MQDRGPVARNEGDESIYLKKTVVEFIFKAEVSKAVSRLNSTGVANMSNPAVIEQMRRNYPDRSQNSWYSQNQVQEFFKTL